MTEAFSGATIDQLAKQCREPSWVTALRHEALTRHEKLPWPHKSDDVWRRTDFSLLDPAKGFTFVPGESQPAISLQDAQTRGLVTPFEGEQLLVRMNGTWISTPRLQGVTVQELGELGRGSNEALRAAIGGNGLTDAEQKFATLNTAFHHDDVVIQVPAQVDVTTPLRLVHLYTAAPQQAIFPLTVVRVGAGSTLTLIDEYISVVQGAGAATHLINGRIELELEQGARLHYVRLQRWSRHAREFLMQRATVGRDASLTMANINLGAALSKAHVVTKLIGEQASTRLYGFVFGSGTQHIDQHTLQEHLAPHTNSDLQFRAALQDSSRMVYTGLIRIAAEAHQTDAYQSNHNLLLSRTAHVETIPMLEILADDVICKHGASMGPIDEEQVFYLMSRGLPRDAAERLLVMGFVEPIVQQVPFAPLQERLRREIEEGLHY